MQEHGCRALANLSHSEGSALAIAAAGGVEAILAAMGSAGASTEVLENGCMALSNLAVVDDIEEAIVQGGGIEAVAHALERHPGAAAPLPS